MSESDKISNLISSLLEYLYQFSDMQAFFDGTKDKIYQKAGK